MFKVGGIVQLAWAGLALAALSPFARAQDPCIVPETSGTVVLPPDGCDYLSPSDVHMIIDGLPVPSTIEVALIHKDFICAYAGCGTPFVCNEADNTIFIGGEKECYETMLELDMTGTVALAGFTKSVTIPAFMETHTDVRPAGPLQVFDAEMTSLFGQLVGDPDFSQLTIVAGQNQGQPPSTGQVTLTQVPGGFFNVESFFDVNYEISFQGNPAGPLAGLAGTTSGVLRMGTGRPVLGPGVPALPIEGVIVLALLFIGAGSVVLRNRSRRQDQAAA